MVRKGAKKVSFNCFRFGSPLLRFTTAQISAVDGAQFQIHFLQMSKLIASLPPPAARRHPFAHVIVSINTMFTNADDDENIGRKKKKSNYSPVATKLGNIFHCFFFLFFLPRVTAAPSVSLCHLHERKSNERLVTSTE